MSTCIRACMLKCIRTDMHNSVHEYGEHNIPHVYEIQIIDVLDLLVMCDMAHLNGVVMSTCIRACMLKCIRTGHAQFYTEIRRA